MLGPCNLTTPSPFAHFFQQPRQAVLPELLNCTTYYSIPLRHFFQQPRQTVQAELLYWLVSCFLCWISAVDARYEKHRTSGATAGRWLGVSKLSYLDDSISCNCRFSNFQFVTVVANGAVTDGDRAEGVARTIGGRGEQYQVFKC